MRVTLSPSGLSSRARYMAVASPSMLGLVQRMTSSDLFVLEPHEQLLHPQLVGPDAFDRVDGALEHVVAAAVLTGLLDRDDVAGLLDDAEHRRVAAGSAQMPHSSPSLMLKHRWHHATRSLASAMARARRRASSLDSFSRWKAMRWADLGPMPGSRPSSSMRSWTGPA